jgi:hypothetical protein
MPHPILKKTRGPSTTGPRPTARFISPHESEDDPISSASGNSNVVVRLSSPEPQSSKVEKKASGASSKKGQGFVASTAGKKKRPFIVRRKSSQSSTETPPRSTETISSTAIDSSFENAPPNVPESSHARNKPPLQSKFQENFSSSSARLPAPLPKKLSTIKHDDSKSTSRESKSGSRKNQIEAAAGLNPPASGGDPGPSTLRAIENGQLPEEDLEVEDREGLELQKTMLAEANLRLEKDQAAAEKPVPQAQDEQFKPLRKSLRSSSQIDTRETGAVRFLSNDIKSTASLASTLAAATGKLDLGDAAEGSQTYESAPTKAGKGKGRDSEDKPSEIFAKRPIPPIAGSSIAAVPEHSGSLLRSKSQLTLLLEKDRTRSGEFKPKDEKRRGKKG